MAVTARVRHPMKNGLPPAWAVAWGEDRYGGFATFSVGTTDRPVEQRMRWIPPGTFVMGSPETEWGRSFDEGPQHEVVLTRGYWLGETPVTQALWVAVMGENPSSFRVERPEALERPVESVSWNDCQMFLSRLNKQVPGLGARLPTETEWERACRAETRGATWVSELSGNENAPELDGIAWYHRNSGGKTHPVGRKAPNPYGLQDMLGNVYEWCADGPYRYVAEPVTDPPATDRDSHRILRGGSWRSSARSVRAADRVANERGDRHDNLGFRLAGGQESALR